MAPEAAARRRGFRFSAFNFHPASIFYGRRRRQVSWTRLIGPLGQGAREIRRGHVLWPPSSPSWSLSDMAFSILRKRPAGPRLEPIETTYTTDCLNFG